MLEIIVKIIKTNERGGIEKQSWRSMNQQKFQYIGTSAANVDKEMSKYYTTRLWESLDNKYGRVEKYSRSNRNY